MTNRSKAKGTAWTESQKLDIASRLWSRIQISDAGCWEFTGYRRKYGHGQIGIGGVLHGTHRVAWSLAHDADVPPGLVVRHSCDNAPCVNPEHLLVGTQGDNVRDAVERGRVARGDMLPHSRMTPDDVRFVRCNYVRGVNARELATRYGVTPNYITAVAAGRERSDVA